MRDYVTPGEGGTLVQADALEGADITVRKQMPPLPRSDANPQVRPHVTGRDAGML